MLELEHPMLSMRQQCELLDINRSNCYYKAKELSESMLALMHEVDEAYTKYPFFGTRQMTNFLRENGKNKNVCRSKIRSVYEKLGLRATCPGPHTSVPHPEHKIYPYLLRNVAIAATNHVWSTDITYLRLRKGYAYLVAIIDWFSRYVLDWELSISLDASFCIETLARVLKNGICDIFNTDQGSQFTSEGFTGLLLANNIQISMDGKGRALDNVFVERLWRSVKYECVYLREWESIKEIRAGLAEYFKFYNFVRPHKAHKGKTPAYVYLT